MNIGGRALANGIILQCENVIVKASRNKHDEIIIDAKLLESKNQNIKNKYEKVIERIPILRGIYSLLIINGNKYIRINIIAIILLDILKMRQLNGNKSDFYLLSLKIFNVVLIVFLLYIFLYLKRFLEYHGVEHKVVNALEQDKPIEINEVKKCSRVNYRCGTIFVIFLLMIFIFIRYVAKFFNIKVLSIQILLSIGLTYEIFDTKFLHRTCFKYIYFIGGLIQKYITTLEPDEKQLGVGIACMNKLIEIINEKNI